MVNEERKEKIVSDMCEILGSNTRIEFSSNASRLVSELLSARDSAPAGLTEELAIVGFFTECIKKQYGVDPEIMDLETQKAYINMEKIIDSAKAKIESAMHDTPDIPPMPPAGDTDMPGTTVNDDTSDATAEETTEEPVQLLPPEGMQLSDMGDALARASETVERIKPEQVEVVE